MEEGNLEDTKVTNKVTKSEIIGVIFSKLQPEGNDIFADVGCGTGAVSQFFSQYVLKTYAVDEDYEAVEITEKRLKDNKTTNVEVIHSSGSDFLERYDYDIVFFGGTRQIADMLDIAANKSRKIVVNLARLEIALEVIQKMKELNIFNEALVVNVAKSYELAGGTAFKSINPVFMVVGEV